MILTLLETWMYPDLLIGTAVVRAHFLLPGNAKCLCAVARLEKSMTSQLSFTFMTQPTYEDQLNLSTVEKLRILLRGDLNFHDKDSLYASHNFHAFPAKFPPQLPKTFIEALTVEGDSVLDPMMGSGTTILEAFLSNRRAIGFDIDPLALRISQVKTTPLDASDLWDMGRMIVRDARQATRQDTGGIQSEIAHKFDEKTRQFIDYWFTPHTQIELQALITAINSICDSDHEHRAQIQNFFEIILSSIIITKSGGVSLALDLAHTRPHKAKIVYDFDGRLLAGKRLAQDRAISANRLAVMTKSLKPPIDEFERSLARNLRALPLVPRGLYPPSLCEGNAQHLPLVSDSVKLVVTSPPYASNAIDYMRAHKFSLVWLGHGIDTLGHMRKEYIGADGIADALLEPLPKDTARIVTEIQGLDEKKGMVLHRYYSEMTRTLAQIFRVLQPGGAAIVVVGSSIMRGQDTQTADCLAEIGAELGFQVPGIGVRQLDRNRRMMPAGVKIDCKSQIQQRMHEEYVIGFYKPE